jgi:hypothetical protein
MSLTPSRKQGKKFLNPIPTDLGGLKILVPVLKEYIDNKAESTPKKTIGPFTTDTSVYQTPPKSGLRVTLIGHSSLLIEIDDKRILTDPVWSHRISFTSLFGPKRFFAPPFALDELEELY